MGLGAMEGKSEQKDLEELKGFYTQLGLMAKQKGIVINLITFEEEESKIEILMAMIDQTGGEIIRVKPTEILEQFSNLLTNEIVATHVSIKVKLHKVMCFRNEDINDIKDNGSTLMKEIGNATKESELYIEYSFKPSSEIAQFQDVDIEKLTSVPFQSIIEYTTPHGDKCIRVVTEFQQLSSEKKVIESQARYDIVSTNAIKKTAKLAQDGHLREAQSNALAWKKMMKSNESSEDAFVNYKIMNKNLNEFNDNLQEMQYVEQSNAMPQSNMTGVGMDFSSHAKKPAMKDNISQKMHQLKNASTQKTVNNYMEEMKKKKK
jgi:hypothetical protein